MTSLIPIPERIDGESVMAVVRIPPDNSTRANVLVVILADSRKRHEGLFSVRTAYFDGEDWHTEHGRYDLVWTRALQIFGERVSALADGPDWIVSTAPDFRALMMNSDLQWSDVSGIKWDDVQVTPGDPTADSDARYVAGKVRDFEHFYAIENRMYARAVERYLTRYSEEHSRVQ